jgi:hypothetical protein
LKKFKPATWPPAILPETSATERLLHRVGKIGYFPNYALRLKANENLKT